eukprot:401919-Pelagomonas_calceolata.AAC.2
MHHLACMPGHWLPHVAISARRAHLAVGLAGLLSNLGDGGVGQQVVGEVSVGAAEGTVCQAGHSLCRASAELNMNETNESQLWFALCWCAGNARVKT